MQSVLTKNAVIATYPESSWQRSIFETFSERLLSEVEPFPCIYGVSGLKAGHLRFSFLDEPLAVPLGIALATYLAEAPSLGTYTSLVTFFAPEQDSLTISDYHERFWSILNELASIDQHPWPTEIPHQIDHPVWEFCFAGEPMFVVCNTPAHVARKSRNSAGFMMTFQPRYVFKDLLGTPQAAQRAVAAVRARLSPYDSVSASPVLGLYGDPSIREFLQYFLEDSNSIPPRCPFHTLGDTGHKAECQLPMTLSKEKVST